MHQKITVCSCTSRSFIHKDQVAGIVAVLRGEGYSVTVEPDLCKKIMVSSPDLSGIASSTILACYPRAVRSLFLMRHLEPQQVIDIRNNGIAGVLDQLHVSPEAGSNIREKEILQEEIAALPVEDGTDAWFPVIDKERCSECRQCHNFCLFGVYEIEEGMVRVKQPQNCKNNCPACARICPAKAIIFPKYEKSPINGGLTDEENMSADTKAMYAEALRMRLQQRRASVPLLKKEDQ